MIPSDITTNMLLLLSIINLCSLIIAMGIYNYDRRHDRADVKLVADKVDEHTRTFNIVADDSGEHYRRILKLEEDIKSLIADFRSYDKFIETLERNAEKHENLKSRINDVLTKYVRLDQYVNSNLESHAKTLNELLNGLVGQDREIDRVETYMEEHVEGLASRIRSVESFNDVVASQLKLITKDLAQCRSTTSSSKGPSAKQPSSQPIASKKSSGSSRTKTPKRSSTTSTAATASSKKKSPKS